MIIGSFHQGSGLGNQLHRYVATRVLAVDKKCEFGMLNPHLFKGKDFMNLDMGLNVYVDEEFNKHFEFYSEKKVVENGVDIRSYDPEINFVQPNTVIDGEFQDERYFKHRLPEISEWLKVEPLEMPDDVCVINFRGGEYTAFPDLFLTPEYWAEAKILMLQKNINMRFEVHTDDVITALHYFDDPNIKIIQDIGVNWRSIRYAKYLILSNSSFAILPALLNQDVKEVIAPRYWARRNTKVWALPQNYYSKFHYV